MVWVTVADHRGHEKLRPAVVLTATEKIDLQGEVVVVAVTTTLEDPLGKEFVELPWSAHQRSPNLFRRRSAAKCDWRRVVRARDCTHSGGHVPPDFIYGEDPPGDQPSWRPCQALWWTRRLTRFLLYIEGIRSGKGFILRSKIVCQLIMRVLLVNDPPVVQGQPDDLGVVAAIAGVEDQDQSGLEMARLG